MHNSLPFQLLFKQKHNKNNNYNKPPKSQISYSFMQILFVQRADFISFHFIVQHKLFFVQKWKIRDEKSHKYLPIQIIMFFWMLPEKSRDI